MTFVILGLTFLFASMWISNTPGTDLSYHDFSLVVLVDNLLLDIHTSFLDCIGVKTGLTTHLPAHFSFGVRGSRLPSLLLGDTQVGRFDVGAVMFSILVGKATGLDVNLLIAVSGLLMAIVVFLDISALTVLSAIAVPAIVYLGSYPVWLTANGMGGLDVLKAAVPTQPLDFNVALALAVGSSVSAGALTADFIRFGRNAKPTVLVAMVAFFLSNSSMFIFGAASAAALGMADTSDVMAAQGLLLPAIAVLGLNVWTTSDSAFYTSGLGFVNITGMSSKILSMANGIIGTVRILWLYNNFAGWLTFLSVAIPSVGGMIVVDYLMNYRHYEHFAITRMTSISWVAILAVALGIAASYWLPGIVPADAVSGGALSYLILNPILNHKTTTAMAHVEANSVE